MPNAVRTLLSEPRIPDPPHRVERDWIMIAIIALIAAVEALLRTDLPWPAAQFVFTVVLSLTLLGRRTNPLGMIALAVGAMLAHEIFFYVVDKPSDGLYAGAFILILPYALLRWGAGREAIPGILMMLTVALMSVFTGTSTVGDTIAAVVFMLFPAELGAAVRYQATSRERRADQVRLQEREQFARELHDTVAHHVSAIAIQAQAGRAVATTDPTAAIRALDAIEAEASRSLAEMRAMVGVLRGSDAAELSPQRGIADIEHLARTAGDSPRVTVELAGDLDDLRPSIGAAVYRLAQESITNARRHARRATAIEVSVQGDESQVRLTVQDDGEASPFSDDATLGFGLEGMAERTKLLGGTFAAGPEQPRGWTIAATIPKGGAQ